MQKLFLLVFFLTVSQLSLSQAWADTDQIQIDPNSMHIKTIQPTSQPTRQPTPVVKTANLLMPAKSPIVDKNSILEYGLSLSVSPEILIFDPLSPTDPVLRNATITIKGAQSSLLLFETQNLQTASGETIPDTSCDSGTCNQTVDDTWSDSLTYGFGYRCDGGDEGCNGKFARQNTYAQIPKSISSNILVHQDSPGQTVSDVVYKINIPSDQHTGSYSTYVRYLLIPGL